MVRHVDSNKPMNFSEKKITASTAKRKPGIYKSFLFLSFY